MKSRTPGWITGSSSISPRASSSGSSRSISDDAEKEIDLGQRLDQLVLVALHHAADATTAWQRPVVLQPSRLDDRVDRLLLRRVDEAARVDDDHLGLGEVVGVLGAAIGELREVALGVDGVLVAAEGDESDLHAGTSGGSVAAGNAECADGDRRARRR